MVTVGFVVKDWFNGRLMRGRVSILPRQRK